MAELFRQHWSREALLRQVGHMEQLAGIRYMENLDGRERLGRVFQVWTGSGLTFRVLADRCLDIAACQYRGVPLAWIAPGGEAHPAYFEPQGQGWLRTFAGGLMTTCGLDTFGAASVEDGQSFGLHGRASDLPAGQVSYRTAWQADEYELEISGEVRQAVPFGENLVLRRRISTRLGAAWLRIEDQVTNEGFVASPHMLLYHCNFGFPLVGENGRVTIDSLDTRARDARAAEGLKDWQRLHAPFSGFTEQVYRHSPRLDPDGQVRVRLSNADLPFSVQITYDGLSLPYLFQWKMLSEGLYALGIEPANCGTIAGRAAARQRQDLPVLAPGETRSYWLQFEISGESG